MKGKVIMVIIIFFLFYGCVPKQNYSESFDQIIEAMNRGKPAFSQGVKIKYDSTFSELVERHSHEVNERIISAIDKGIEGKDAELQYQKVSKSLRTIFYRELRIKLAQPEKDFDEIYDLYTPLKWVINKRKGMVDDGDSFVLTPEIILEDVRLNRELPTKITEFEYFMDEVFVMSFAHELNGLIEAISKDSEEQIDLKVLESNLYLETIQHRIKKEDLEKIVEELNKEDREKIDMKIYHP